MADGRYGRQDAPRIRLRLKKNRYASKLTEAKISSNILDSKRLSKNPFCFASIRSDRRRAYKNTLAVRFRCFLRKPLKDLPLGYLRTCADHERRTDRTDAGMDAGLEVLDKDLQRLWKDTYGDLPVVFKYLPVDVAQRRLPAAYHRLLSLHEPVILRLLDRP